MCPGQLTFWILAGTDESRIIRTPGADRISYGGALTLLNATLMFAAIKRPRNLKRPF